MRFVLLALLACAAGCGDDSSQVSCTNDATCTAISIDLGGGPRCCGGFCVFPSVGCDSGVRYLTGSGAFGSCVPASLCAPADMSMMPSPPHDLAMSTSD